MARRYGFLRRMLRGRNLLVASQVAISLLLMTVSSLLYVGVYNSVLSSFQNPGFQVDHLLMMDFDASIIHPKGVAATQFFTQLMERLRSTNGVEAAAVQYQSIAAIRPEGLAKPEDVQTSAVWTDEGFFDTLGIPILRGRPFQTSDLGHAPAVVVVNEVLARRYWPGQDAIGKHVRLGGDKGQFVEVVGVAKIDDYMAFGVPPMDIVFLPFASVPAKRDVRMLVRSARDPYVLVESIRKIVRALDPDQALPQADTWQNTYGIFSRLVKLGTHTIGAMGVLGLALALVGLYGLLVFEVNSRTREIGIRMALGATQSSVVRMVLRQGIALAVCGVGAGLALNSGVAHLLVATLGTGSKSDANAAATANAATTAPPSPNDGNQVSVHVGSDTFANYSYYALVLAVFLITIVASYIPARRASRVDPNVALRCE